MSEPTEESGSEFTATAGPQGVSLSGKGRKVSEIITGIALAALFAVAYMVHLHEGAADRRETAIAVAIKELAKSQQDSVTAQREMTCIISLPQDKREAEFASPFGLCKRIAR